MKVLRAAVLVSQVALAVFYIWAGSVKTFMPMAELADIIPWTGDYSTGFVRFTGIVDLLAGLGILLPDVLHILPRLTILAAAGSALLQVLAIVFHIWRDEFAVLLLNFSALALSLLILWGWGKQSSSDKIGRHNVK